MLLKMSSYTVTCRSGARIPSQDHTLEHPQIEPCTTTFDRPSCWVEGQAIK